MNKRVNLKQGDYLDLQRFCGTNKERSRFLILDVIGEGGSTACYEAKLGQIRGRLKEFSPIDAWGDPVSRVKLARNDLTKQLFCLTGQEEFRRLCEGFLRPYLLLGEIRDGRNSVQGISAKTLNNYMPVYDLFCTCPENESYAGSVYVWTPGDREGIEFGSWLDQTRAELLLKPNVKQASVLGALKVILETVYALTDCVSILHMCGLLYLDIKPANFLMACDSKGKVIPGHISLFDVNSLFDMESDIQPAYIGTEGYTAPELRYGKADPRADIYSIGALIYRAMVLEYNPARQYKDEDYSAISRVVRDSFLLRQLETPEQAHLEDMLAGILRKCLAYDRSKRYRSCEELKQEIAKAITCLQEKSHFCYGGDAHESNAKGALQLLLTDHPLYRHLESEDQKLQVAVLGEGTWSRCFLDLVLTVSQNLRNPLSVTFYAGDADNARYRYRCSRPALSGFIRIDGKCSCDGALAYADLNYRELPDPGRMADIFSRKKPSYVFVSLGTDRESCYAARQLLCENRTVVCVYQGDGTLKPDEIEAPQEKNFVLLRILDRIRPRRSLEQMAFNSFLSWRGDGRGSFQSEKKHFREKYQYNASMAYAVSVTYKLQMMQMSGILPRSKKKAVIAEQLRTVLENDDCRSLLDELAMREHKRWVMDKITGGWRGPGGTLSAAYYKGVEVSGEVRMQQYKIHPCIVHSRAGVPLCMLTKEEWDNREYIPGNADDLDLVSLAVHRSLHAAGKDLHDLVFSSNHGLYCDYKQFDYDLIRAIPDILTADPASTFAAYSYHPQPADTSAIQLSEDMLAIAEMLAENSHEIWAQSRIAEGWHYGKLKSERLRTTPCLVPYNMLPEEEKDYDRNTALGVIKLLIKLGYQICRVHNDMNVIE